MTQVNRKTLDKVSSHLSEGDAIVGILTADTLRLLALHPGDHAHTNFTFDKVSDVINANRAREGLPKALIPTEQVYKVQVALAWDRQIHSVPTDAVKLYVGRALPFEVDMNQLFAGGSPARFVSIPWKVGGTAYCGVWAVADVCSESNRPVVRFTLMSAADSSSDLHLRFFMDTTWDSAVYESALAAVNGTGHLGSTLGSDILKSYLNQMMLLEGLLAAVYDVLTDARPVETVSMPRLQGAHL